VVSRVDVANPQLELVGQMVREDAKAPDSDKVVVAAGETLTAETVEALKKAGVSDVRIKSVASSQIVYLPADREVNVMIAQANTPLDDDGRIAVDEVTVRLGSDGHRFPVVRPSR
jgi:DNA-directed RNA polymerase beta subunit